MHDPYNREHSAQTFVAKSNTQVDIDGVDVTEATHRWQELRDLLRRSCQDALGAVGSLVSHDFSTAFRDSTDATDYRTGDGIRPTVTAHVALAFLDYGVQFAGSTGSTSTSAVLPETFSGISTSKLSRTLSYESLFDSFLMLNAHSKDTKAALGAAEAAPFPIDKASMLKFAKDESVSATQPHSWAVQLLKQSTHFRNSKPDLRETICLGHTLHAVRALWSCLSEEFRDTRNDRLVAGVAWLTARVWLVLTEEIGAQGVEQNTARWEIAPYYALNIASALKAVKELSFEAKVAEESRYLMSTVDETQQLLRDYFSCQVERMMARSRVKGDHFFDVTTLVLALRGHQLAGGAFDGPFVKECVNVVLSYQLENGCWPDGTAIPSTLTRTLSPASQPSVELALALAAYVFDRRLLVSPSSHDLDVAHLALAALSKHLDYLLSNVRRLRHQTRTIWGWCSDRLRAPGYVETWTTCLAARVMHMTYLIGEASERAEILSKYRTRRPSVLGERPGTACARFENQMREPDSLLNPINWISKELLSPLDKMAASGKYFLIPPDRARSFVTFGPPGSGKTYLVRTLAESLGWPLVELHPGDFVRYGIERIEEVASDIFRDIQRLFHAVVFLDEGDELFRDRNQASGKTRNMLSFATASMLPKLQDLHDSGRVIFIVATNFVSHIDVAVRRQDRFDKLILLDRPDMKARESTIVQVRSDLALEKLEQPDLRRLAKELGGLAHGDIKRVARMQSPAAPLDAEDRRTDYLTWWRDNGHSEITAGGLASRLLQIRDRIRKEVPSQSEFNFSSELPLEQLELKPARRGSANNRTYNSGRRKGRRK